jgi:hypothetical protein
MKLTRSGPIDLRRPAAITARLLPRAFLLPDVSTVVLR